MTNFSPRRRLELALFLALFGACWSFPESLLHDAGPQRDLSVVGDGPALSDGPAVNDGPALNDGPAVNDGPVNDATAVNDAPADQRVPCEDPCPAATPICGNNGCRGCRSHAECDDAGGLCVDDGSCPAEADITYVAAPPACESGAKDGSLTGPYCTIQDALGDAKNFIRVDRGDYGALEVGRDCEIYGAAFSGDGVPQAVLADSSNACQALVIGGGITVLVSGFKIGTGPNGQGGVLIKDAGTEATLVRNTIGPSTCVGVDGGTDTTVELRANLIEGNTGGGVQLLGVASHRVVNNFIVKNGTKEMLFGGANLEAAGAPALFINNTVAGNQSIKAKGLEWASGVRCAGSSLDLLNSIIWDNASSDDKNPAKDQYRNCTLSYCDALDASGSGNLSQDPLFKGPDDFHLQGGSPLKNKGIKSAETPALDYDREPRDDPPDIGADEIVP